MNVGGFFDFLGAVLAIAACTTLVFSVLGAAFGVRHSAQQGDTRSLKWLRCYAAALAVLSWRR